MDNTQTTYAEKSSQLNDNSIDFNLEILSKFPNANRHYLSRYIRLINHPWNLDGYTEKHHILPKAKNHWPECEYSTWNIVGLPLRVHWLAHYLLYKSLNTPQMIRAFTFMSSKGKKSKLCEKSKIEFITVLSNECKGKTTYIHKETGKVSRYCVNDPLIKSGILCGTTKGKCTYLNIETGERVFCETDSHDRIIGNLVGLNHGIGVYRNLLTGETISSPVVSTDQFLVGVNRDRNYITNGVENKMITKDDPTPDGWTNGCTKSVKPITNGIKDMFISKDDPIPDGWWNGKSSISKLTNIYDAETHNLIAEFVYITKFCKDNGYNQGVLSLTARADRTTKHISGVNPHFHDGIYARYINETGAVDIGVGIGARPSEVLRES